MKEFWLFMIYPAIFLIAGITEAMILKHILNFKDLYKWLTKKK